MRGEYSIIRFVPQPERGESVTLGVILVSPSQDQVFTHFRESSTFESYPPHLRPTPEIVASFEKQLHHIPKEKRSGELSSLLLNLNHDLQNSIQASVPHACNFDDAKAFLNSIFTNLVLPPGQVNSKSNISHNFQIST